MHKWECNELPEDFTIDGDWYDGYSHPNSTREIISSQYHWVSGYNPGGYWEGSYFEWDSSLAERNSTKLEVETKIKIFSSTTLADYAENYNAGTEFYSETKDGWIDIFFFSDGIIVEYSDGNEDYQEEILAFDTSIYHIYKFTYGNGSIIIDVDGTNLLTDTMKISSNWGPYLYWSDNYDGEFVTEHYIDYIYFGIVNSTDISTIAEPALNGVYTLGNYSPSYPQILDLTYPISQRSGTDFVLNGIEIGSICISEDTILVSWYDHNTNTKGIDVVDWDTKLDGAYIETKLIPVYRRAFANYTGFIVAYSSLPSNTAIGISYSKDYGATYIESVVIDDTMRKIINTDESIEATQLQLKFTITTNYAYGPTIESIGVQIS